MPSKPAKDYLSEIVSRVKRVVKEPVILKEYASPPKKNKKPLNKLEKAKESLRELVKIEKERA